MLPAALGYTERVVGWIFRQHFRIPPAGFWALAIGGAVLAPFLSLTPALVAGGVAAIGVWGIFRWRWHRRKTGLVVLARPVTVDPTDRLAARAQELAMEALAARLTPGRDCIGPSDPGSLRAYRGSTR